MDSYRARWCETHAVLPLQHQTPFRVRIHEQHYASLPTRVPLVLDHSTPVNRVRVTTGQGSTSKPFSIPIFPPPVVEKFGCPCLFILLPTRFLCANFVSFTSFSSHLFRFSLFSFLFSKASPFFFFFSFRFLLSYLFFFRLSLFFYLQPILASDSPVATVVFANHPTTSLASAVLILYSPALWLIRLIRHAHKHLIICNSQSHQYYRSLALPQRCPSFIYLRYFRSCAWRTCSSGIPSPPSNSHPLLRKEFKTLSLNSLQFAPFG